MDAVVPGRGLAGWLMTCARASTLVLEWVVELVSLISSVFSVKVKAKWVR